MDFLKIIRSLEELLYEVMTWRVFYPRTMWRIATRPLETTSDSERGRNQKDWLYDPIERQPAWIRERAACEDRRLDRPRDNRTITAATRGAV